jgi:hypothetical protein
VGVRCRRGGVISLASTSSLGAEKRRKKGEEKKGRTLRNLHLSGFEAPVEWVEEEHRVRCDREVEDGSESEEVLLKSIFSSSVRRSSLLVFLPRRKRGEQAHPPVHSPEVAHHHPRRRQRLVRRPGLKKSREDDEGFHEGREAVVEAGPGALRRDGRRVSGERGRVGAMEEGKRSEGEKGEKRRSKDARDGRRR